VEDMVCASCHKGLSLEEIERGSFKHLGGRVYCADCVAKMRRVGPTVCSQCGVQDTPLYNGKTYVCRKCGAEVGRKEQATAAKAAPAKTIRKPVKKCPYCGALLAAEALKCRYCSSLLTREAHELDRVGGQNSRLRFWVGCLLSATAFLLIFLVYVLTRGPAETPPAAVTAPQPPPAPTIDKATHEADQERIKELSRQIELMQKRLAFLEAERVALREQPVPPIPRTPAREPSITKAVEPPPKAPVAPEPVKEAAKAVAAPPKEATKAPPDVTPSPTPPSPPPTKMAANPPSKAVEPVKATPAEVAAAAAAYPALEAKLKDLKANRRYGEAIAACRLYLAAHAGTPQGDRVQADQSALRADLERIIDDHVRRFREAMGKGDPEAARRALAGLVAYEAPEARDARDHMLAQLKEAGQRTSGDEAKYLAQWEAPPNVARLLGDLKTEKEWEQRAHAAKELDRLRHRAALGGLIDALKDPEWYVVTRAAEALANIGDPIALPHIAPLAQAPHPAISDTAAKACRTLAGASRETQADAWKLVDTKKVAAGLAEALKVSGKDESKVISRYQIYLVDALASLGVKETAPVIRSILESKDPDVRKAAGLALKKLTGEDMPAEPPRKAPEETKAPINATPPPPAGKEFVPVRFPEKAAP